MLEEAIAKRQREEAGAIGIQMCWFNERPTKVVALPNEIARQLKIGDHALRRK
jgi:hypothetical protein